MILKHVDLLFCKIIRFSFKSRDIHMLPVWLTSLNQLFAWESFPLVPDNFQTKKKNDCPLYSLFKRQIDGDD